MLSAFQRAKAQCADMPWCQDEPDKLGPCIVNHVMDQEQFIKRWAQKWFENFQFIYGNQNIRWSQRYDFAVDVDFLRRDSPLATRSQTNIARTVAEALAALIYSDLPTWETETAEESSQKGKRYRKIAEKILDCYTERLCMDKEFCVAALIYVVYGQVAGCVDFDYNSGRIIEIPKWQKNKVPVYTDYMAPNPALGGLLESTTQALDAQGQPVFEETWEPVKDASGKQVVDRRFAGDARITVLTPLEYFREPGSSGMHTARWVRRVRLMDYDLFLREYDRVEGKTKYYDQIIPKISDTALYGFAIRHYMRMQYTTPPAVMDRYKRSDSPVHSTLFRKKVLVIEHWDRPNPEMWPEGRRVIVVNGHCTHIAKPQYRTNKLDGWHPFVEAQWMTIAPSSIATGPLNDVVAKNRENNLLDSYTSTAIRRNLGSVLLTKIGGGFDPQKLTGEPGQAMPVVDPSSAARWLHDENPIPPVIKELKEIWKDEIYEVSGAQDAIRGDRSKGASSGYMLKQLEEREQKRLTPARKNFEYFGSGLGEKLLACLKQNVERELDNDVMGFLKRSAAGEFETDDVLAFLATPMDFGVDVNIRTDSMSLRSKATMQATLLELVQKTPAGQRLAQSAETLDNFLKFYDAEVLRDASAGQRDRAERENEIFTDMSKLGVNAPGLRQPIVIFEDDDIIHAASHTEWAVKNSDMLLTNPPLMQAYLLHQETHRIQGQSKQGQLPPGASLQVPQMMAQSSSQPAPQLQQVAQQNQQMQAQAAKHPAPVGSKGPPQKDPAAPSANTAPPSQQGGQQ